MSYLLVIYNLDRPQRGLLHASYYTQGEMKNQLQKIRISLKI